MVKTVVRGRGWTPSVIDNLYLDAVDFHGLEFWYNDVLEESEALNKK